MIAIVTCPSQVEHGVTDGVPVSHAHGKTQRINGGHILLCWLSGSCGCDARLLRGRVPQTRRGACRGRRHGVATVAT